MSIFVMLFIRVHVQIETHWTEDSRQIIFSVPISSDDQPAIFCVTITFFTIHSYTFYR